MNITQTPQSDLSALIQINLVEADYTQEVDKSLKEYQHKAAMPGFRPGKVPFGMIKKMYGKQVMAEKVNDIVSEALNKYIVDNKIRILGQPLSNNEKNAEIDFENDVDFNFYFEIGIAPEITLDLSKVKATYLKVKATDDDIEKTVNEIAKNQGTTSHPETVEENDQLELKIHQLDDDKEEVQDGLEKNIHLFVEQIKNKTVKKTVIGKELGAEFVFDFVKALGSEEAVITALELDENQKELAKSKFNVIINDIERKVPAEINETLFNNTFPNAGITDLEGFKAKLAEEMEKHYAAESDKYFYEKAIDAVVEAHPFDIPDDFLKRWMMEINEGKITENDIAENYDKYYARTLRWQLIEQEIVKNNENLHISEQEIRDQVKKYFFPTIMNAEAIDEEMNKRLEGVIDNLLKEENQRTQVTNQLAQQKMTDFFKGNLKIKEKEVTYDGFIKELQAENPIPNSK